MTNELLPCLATERGLSVCMALSDRLRLGKGLHPMDCIEWAGDRARTVRRGVTHGTGRNAMVLNFCPWCGTNLRPAFESLCKD